MTTEAPRLPATRADITHRLTRLIEAAAGQAAAVAVVQGPPLSGKTHVATEAAAIAHRIAEGPHFANTVTKVQLEREMDVSFSAAIEMEAQAQAICMMHPDFREAFDAWTEKRAPKFR